LDVDDQDTLNRFRKASAQYSDVVSRPEPAPKQTKGATAEKTSEPAAGGTLPPPVPVPGNINELPASLRPPHAPTIYRTDDFTPYIDAASKKYGVDADLIKAMMKQESANNPKAVSDKNAHGLMQLRPETAKEYGVKNIDDPEENIDAGTHYMADLLKRYDGDEAKALAAYNAGPTAVEKYNGVPPFQETKTYVAKIQGRNKQ
jgi:soluble lytic murein transglycosylase-like protein